MRCEQEMFDEVWKADKFNEPKKTFETLSRDGKERRKSGNWSLFWRRVHPKTGWQAEHKNYVLRLASRDTKS